MKKISIIIPVKNEALNLTTLFSRINKACSKAGVAYTAIIVDDHSTDKSIQVLYRLKKKYPIQIHVKKGAVGKAFSILQGAKLAKTKYIAMLDADLQYPPEAIPKLFQKAIEHDTDVVVAKRIMKKGSPVRIFVSKACRFLVGKVLFGVSYDIQSGLKIFTKDIVKYIDERRMTGWTFDIELMRVARLLGKSIGEVPIDFHERFKGKSNINLIQSSIEIFSTAIFTRISAAPLLQLPSSNVKKMLGSGLFMRQKMYVTHSTLRHNISAALTFTLPQKFVMSLLILCIAVGLFTSPMNTLIVLITILSIVYLIDVFFNLYTVNKSLHTPPEIAFSNKDVKSIDSQDLPIYSILCPLYKEGHVLPKFLKSISKLDWPKDKLDVLLLLEEDDKTTIDVVRSIELPSYVRVLIVPYSLPKTKPKACNYGLAHARGKYLVIFDAEDVPEPQQLKKAFLGFQTLPSNIRCLQAKLNYYNPHQNILTRLFTAEYSLWFDVILPGLQSMETTIPLGGTSNHFNTKDLKELRGWDAFNVTEDCDLGVRFFKQGYKTAIIESTTLEEANSNVRNWIRQRSRWIKGYLQTYLVHMRTPYALLKKHGRHALFFQLMIGMRVTFILINPILWIATFSYFAFYQYVGPTIESLYPTWTFYTAATSLVVGNFLFLYNYMIGCAKRSHWSIIKYVFFIPFYWAVMSLAAAIAFYQLLVKPHHWEKTHHGLYMKKARKISRSQTPSKQKAFFPMRGAVNVIQARLSRFSTPLVSFRLKNKQFFQNFFKVHRLVKRTLSDAIRGKYRGGTVLVIATVFANAMNMATNLYLGRELNLEDFAVFNTYLSILNIVFVCVSALSTTINQHTATILGRSGKNSAKGFWHEILSKTLIVAFLAAIGWIFLLPTTTKFVNLHSIVPLLLFTPAIFFAGIHAVNLGYLRGSLVFERVAVIIFLLPLTRLLLAVTIGESPFHHFAYVSIPASLVFATVISQLFARQGIAAKVSRRMISLPKTFFFLAILSNLSSISFFTLDNIFVAHYLTQTDTGLYGIMGLLGKMIFFSGSLILGFIIPITAFKEGKGKSSDEAFKKLLKLTTGMVVIAYVIIGLGVPLTAPIFFGEKINAVRFLLPFYGIGILFFTISQAITQFHLAKKEFEFAFVSFLLAVLQVLSLRVFHSSLTEIVAIMTITGTLNFIILLSLHHYYKVIAPSLKNIFDFSDLITGNLKLKNSQAFNRKSNRILIFNWRDTKHVWAGGAEGYIHELAKELVNQGHRVTVFCGNDGKSKRNEVVDKVQIVRRGGFYTVYIWAFLYYVLRFRNIFDIVIDSENGIPFLTPLYVRVPIFLLVHHIHQDIFRTQLKFPLSTIASFIEGDVMTTIYQKCPIITVSNSSKQAIIDLGLGDADSIQVVNPGITNTLFSLRRKTQHPTLVYVGRLKPYKNIDVAIRAFKRVLRKFPNATFLIAGVGESLLSLQALTESLKINKSVKFLSRINDRMKAKLFAESWLAVQPSSIEGWGITVIEANAAGTPVIGSDVHGLRDSILDGETGVLVKEKSVSRFSKSIEALFKDEEKRIRMSETAFAWSQQFNWKSSSVKFLNIVYSNLMYRPIVSNASSQSKSTKTVRAYE